MKIYTEQLCDCKKVVVRNGIAKMIHECGCEGMDNG
ncbi:hypothetical protein JNUCC1_03327 [Lentibacillus sp. JNUCC-1]|nr:hypothetical protein [Lentibacillus sp. JNUCC-1]